MKLTFRTKLFLYFIVIILFTSVPIALVSYNYMYTSLKEDLISSTDDQMVQINRNVYNMINQIKENAKFLSINENVIKADESISALFNIPNIEQNKKYSRLIPGLESEIYSEFENYGTTHPETTYAYLGTKWGGYIQWPDGLSTSKFDPRERPWYSLALNNPDKVMISPPYTSAIDKSNKVIVSASTIVKSASGEIVGAVGIDMSLDTISEMIRTIKVGKTGYIFLYLNDGTMLAHPNAKLNFKNILELNELDYKTSKTDESLGFSFENYDKLINENNGNFETVINGVPVIVNIYTSPDTGWKMAAVIEKSELLHKADKVGYIIISISLLALLLVILLTYIVTKRITKPISELTPLMQAAGNGDFSISANINTNDEFGELGKSFNLMIGKLSSSYEELSSVYEELLATEEELRSQYKEIQCSEEALRNSDERYRLALECANDSIWQWDLVTGEFFASERLTEITGYNLSKTNNLLESVVSLMHPDDLERAKEDIYNHINNANSFYNSEYRFKISDGSYIWILSRGKALRNEEGKIVKFAGSFSDISSRKKSEEKIKYMAYYDSLTELPNRTLFLNRLEEQLNSSNSETVQGAVFFIDLDNFKNINDTMGHNYGDKLLIHLSKQFKSLINENDTICRLGGDEFLLLSTSIKESEVEAYAERLLNLFKGNLKIDNKQLYTTASIGVALYPKDGTDANTILRNADSAMYKAKELGKNRFALFNPEMYLSLERKTTIERILRTAIENNELSINYQPQYDAISNKIYGFEALLRLNSKELGFISPLEFIPVAEECGYITQLGQWVFRESCIQAVKWLKEGYEFKSMSINISSVDLQQPDLLENVNKIMKDAGIDPNIVELEITETVLMQSVDSSIKVLEKLMDMGIRIALDDFGTGYSSLSYLRKIPISTLKIDKSFIDNITSDKKEEAIIKNIIQMAHNMDLKVVAEGVETKEQLSILKERKCDFIQGYYFSKPLPAVEVEKLFDKE